MKRLITLAVFLIASSSVAAYQTDCWKPDFERPACLDWRSAHEACKRTVETYVEDARDYKQCIYDEAKQELEELKHEYNRRLRQSIQKLQNEYEQAVGEVKCGDFADCDRQWEELEREYKLKATKLAEEFRQKAQHRANNVRASFTREQEKADDSIEDVVEYWNCKADYNCQLYCRGDRCMIWRGGE